MRVTPVQSLLFSFLPFLIAAPAAGMEDSGETGASGTAADAAKAGEQEPEPEPAGEEGEEAAAEKVVLSEDEVTAIMESDAVREAFYECASLHAHPTHIDFSFIVNAKGKVTLFGTEPEVSQELFSCFRAVTRVVEFEGKGEKFEITYPMKLPPYLQLKKKKAAHPKKTAGWILFGLGYAMLAAGGSCGAAALVLDRDLEDACPDFTCGPEKRGTVDRVGALALSADVLLSVGGALTVTGIILLALDAREEKRGKGGKGKPSRVGLLAPAGLSLAWEF
jgi:hypothetical protein